jgi:cytochrome c oxidase cbb3-type subunit 3
MSARQIIVLFCAGMIAAGVSIAQAPGSGSQPKAAAAKKGAPRDPAQSPAATPRPKAASTEAYPVAEVRSGEQRFVSQCGFCHGRDAAGGETGPDLTRSELVAADVHGDKIGQVVRSGRADAGMPAFQIADKEMQAIVAFIHTQATKFASLSGGRRTVDASDLSTGNAADGEGFFNGAGGCSGCHSPSGDLAGVAKRYDALTLMQRMLYPSGRPAPAPPKATITLQSGQTITAPVAAEDEFSVVILDTSGARQTYAKNTVKVKIDNPMSAHFEQLGKYTDAQIHNVFAYLETLQ